MTVHVNLPSHAYAVGQQQFPITVGANITALIANFTRESWPDGAVAKIDMLWSDGEGSSFTLSGGSFLDRHGVLSNPPSVTITVSKAPGITQGTVTFHVLQAITTAITVNSQ